MKEDKKPLFISFFCIPSENKQIARNSCLFRSFYNTHHAVQTRPSLTSERCLCSSVEWMVNSLCQKVVTVSGVADGVCGAEQNDVVASDDPKSQFGSSSAWRLKVRSSKAIISAATSPSQWSRVSWWSSSLVPFMHSQSDWETDLAKAEFQSCLSSRTQSLVAGPSVSRHKLFQEIFFFFILTAKSKVFASCFFKSVLIRFLRNILNKPLKGWIFLYSLLDPNQGT